MPSGEEIIFIAHGIAVGGDLLSTVCDATLDTFNIYKVWRQLWKTGTFHVEIHTKWDQAAMCCKIASVLKKTQTFAMNKVV